MAKEMVFNCTDYETRIAVLENGLLSNIYIERTAESGIVGNIYVGKVVRVLPGIQAAFVDIGLDRTAFLYVADITPDYTEFEYLMVEADENGAEETIDLNFERKPYKKEYTYHIEEIIMEGQDILVQVSKEPLGSKGARLTTNISLPGRNLVFMPTVNHIGISRRISDETERKRLREAIEKLRPEKQGFIARTVSEGKSEEELRADVEYLTRLWDSIQRKKDKIGVPGLVHREIGITLRAIRDIYTADVSRIVVDSPKEAQRIVEFMGTFMPKAHYYLERYDKQEPIFDFFGVELDISKALNRKVWLKSGGYIVIETTEALSAIDVNTGKYVGKRNLEETILNTNLEAVKELSYQVRLRNIGGIIIIDFIDMENETHREKVFNALKEEMQKDKCKTNILKISELGLIEMTRQRNGKNIDRILCDVCPYCEGKGLIKSKTSVCYEIFREIEREGLRTSAQSICILANSEIANLLLEDERNTIEKMEVSLKKKIIVKMDNSFHQENYEIIPVQ
jgi:ribonuclease G